MAAIESAYTWRDATWVGVPLARNNEIKIASVTPQGHVIETQSNSVGCTDSTATTPDPDRLQDMHGAGWRHPLRELVKLAVFICSTRARFGGPDSFAGR